MRLTRGDISAKLCVIGLFGMGLVACTMDSSSGGAGGTTSQGGSGGGSGGAASGGSGSGGTVSSGGTTTTSDSGGTVASGGTTSSGGAEETGGTTATGTGGRTPRGTGGSTSTDTSSGGDSGTGGSSGKGGMVGGTGGRSNPGTGGRTGAGGATTQGTAGSTGTGECVKGQTKGTNVAVCGESFIAIAHGLTKELEALATAAGSLKAGEHYDDESISGTWMSSGSNSIPDQYKKAQQKNDIKYVVMDGGGNDCMNGGTGDPIITAATALFKQMATDGVQKVVYFWMPDPVGSNWGSLKSCLDAVRPKIKSLCEGLTAPKCYYVDLRESWNGHPEYTSDGIHPTNAGDKASAKQIWDVMVKNCVAQ